MTVAKAPEQGSSVRHNWQITRFITAWAPLIIVFFIYAYFAWIVRTPYFSDGYNIVNILIQVSPLLIATCGQILVMTVGGLDISIGAIAAFSSMAIAFGTISVDSPAGIILGLVAGAALGAVNGFIVARYRISAVIVTIAMLSSARGLAFLVTDGRPLVGIPASVYWFGWGDLWGIPVPIVLGVVAFLLTEYLLAFTDVGVHLRAVGSDEAGARMMGVRVERLKVLAFSLSGLAGALASVIWTSQSGGGNQLIGSGLELQTIAAAVIGGASDRGTRSALGGLWGAIVIITLSNGMNLSGVQPYTQQIVLGVALILTVIINRMQGGTHVWLRKIFSKGATSNAEGPSSGTNGITGERGRM